MRGRFHVKMHLPQRTLDSAWEQDQVYGRMGAALAELGITHEFVLHNRDTALAQVQADGDFHIFDHGRVQHPRALNCGSAYIAPYHYLDPIGIRCHSSIGQRPFDPAQVDADQARQFQQQLFETYAAARKSRYDQPEQRIKIPQGCIAVFLQSESHRGVGETLYVRMRKMIKALLARDDPRPIVVKPHPRDVDFDTLGWLGQKSRKDQRLQVIPANIHDILSACSVVVTINSAVGIEAMIHNRPVITCGLADFHHATHVVREAEEFATAIPQAETHPWPHAQYLYWFLQENCISMHSQRLGRDIVAKIAATGHVQNLGLNSADLL